MNFCSFCDNMLFIRNSSEQDEVKVEYFCKYCGNIEDFNAIHTHVDESHETTSYVPKYVDHDMTLPRVKDTECVNCKKNTEMLLLRQDNLNKKYLYYCISCKSTFQP